jgi:hypothetical protein
MLASNDGHAPTAHEHIMKLAEQFRENAEEWRQIEKIAATDDHRRRIAAVADTWLAWADRRERMVLRTAKPRKLLARVEPSDRPV